MPADAPRYVSLVPTQMRRLMADAASAAALAAFDAVLVGGAPSTATLPDNAVATYGMTETCGGCVYDGLPLDGVRVGTLGDRLMIAAPTLADGYADGDTSAFVRRDAERWFLTSDAGRIANGIVTVLGRADDVIITGGHKVHPVVVERALTARPDIADAVVVPVDDPEWGQAVVALIVVDGAAVPTQAQVRAELPVEPYERPRAVYAVDAVPRKDSGKIDRVAASTLARAAANVEESP